MGWKPSEVAAAIEEELENDDPSPLDILKEENPLLSKILTTLSWSLTIFLLYAMQVNIHLNANLAQQVLEDYVEVNATVIDYDYLWEDDDEDPTEHYLSLQYQIGETLYETEVTLTNSRFKDQYVEDESLALIYPVGDIGKIYLKDHYLRNADRFGQMWMSLLANFLLFILLYVLRYYFAEYFLKFKNKLKS